MKIRWKRAAAILLTAAMLPFENVADCFVLRAQAAQYTEAESVLNVQEAIDGQNSADDSGAEAVVQSGADVSAQSGEEEEESAGSTAAESGEDDTVVAASESAGVESAGVEGAGSAASEGAGDAVSGNTDAQSAASESAGTDGAASESAGTQDAAATMQLRGNSGGAETALPEIHLDAMLDDRGIAQLFWKIEPSEQTEEPVFRIYKNEELYMTLEGASADDDGYFRFADKEIEGGQTYQYFVEQEVSKTVIYKSDEACVKIPNVLNIENDYVSLDEDTVVLDLNMTNGSLKIKEGHKLVVLRNASIRDSSVSLAGMLCCNGNMSSYDSDLYMYYDEESFLYVGGDTLWKNGTVYFEDGSARFDGNFVMENCCYGYDGFRVIFGGDSRQDIDISLNSVHAEFPVIESQNTSSEGIHFSKGFNCRGMELGDNIAYFGETKAVDDWILTEDTEYEGDLYLMGTIDLNGHSLTVNGDLLQPNGKIMINGGKLNIQGDYRIENASAEEPQYTVSNGTLDMENELDEIIVNGDLAVCNEYCLYINSGKMEVKGDILLASYYFDEGYFTKGNCALDFGGWLILSGEEKQEFRSENEAYMRVAELFLTNSSEDGISMHDCIEVSEYIEDQSRYVEGTLRLWDTVAGKFRGNAKGGLKVSDELTIGGDLMISGSLNITGSLEVQGNLTMDSYSSLSMTEEAYLLVQGDFYVKEHAEVKLDAGTVECKGNLISEGGLEATGTNRFLFSGEEKQLISTVYPDRFAVIELKNTSDDGVLAESVFDYIQLIRNDSKFEFTQEALDRDKCLSEDTVHEGDLILTGGFMNLNGHELHVTGNVIHENGVIDLNNGRLIVDGDYRIQTMTEQDGQQFDEKSSGQLLMNDESDYVLVKGSLYIHTDLDTEKNYTAGVLEVQGDLTVNNDSGSRGYFPTGSHKLLLSGNRKQTIKMNNSDVWSSHVNHLEITNTSQEGVVLEQMLYACGEINDHENRVQGDLKISPEAKFVNGHFGGNLYTCDGYMEFDEDLVIDGDLRMISYSAYIRKDLTVKGNCYIQDDTYLYGKLTVGGTCRLTSGTMEFINGSLITEGNFEILYNGYPGIKMEHEGDYVLVKGNTEFHPYAYRTQLRAGTIEVKGNFASRRGMNASGTHRFVLSGDKKQTATVNYSATAANLPKKVWNLSGNGISAASSITSPKLYLMGGFMRKTILL